MSISLSKRKIVYGLILIDDISMRQYTGLARASNTLAWVILHICAITVFAWANAFPVFKGVLEGTLIVEAEVFCDIVKTVVGLLDDI